MAVTSLVAVIVNYNSESDSIRCIDSMLAQKICPPKNIVLVDNNSPDGSGLRLRAHFPQISTLLSERNDGYGAGVNLGVVHVQADFYLILNPDTYFQHNRMDEALALFKKHHDLGILGMNLLNPDGTQQYSARTFYSAWSILLRRSQLGKLGLFHGGKQRHLMEKAWGNGPFSADWVMGTGFIVRQQAFDQLQGMDEAFFLYMEDVDLCARMWAHGWQVWADPRLTLIHDHQRHSDQKMFSRSAKMHLKSLARFRYKFGLPWFVTPSRDWIRHRFLRNVQS